MCDETKKSDQNRFQDFIIRERFRDFLTPNSSETISESFSVPNLFGFDTTKKWKSPGNGKSQDRDVTLWRGDAQKVSELVAFIEDR